MEEIKVIRVYNLLDIYGNKLQLRLGVIQKFYDVPVKGDEGFRWSFVGMKIPMPVRSGAWFNGFPAHIMLDWLKGNGWCVHTRVDTTTNRVLVYDMHDEEAPYELSELAIKQGEGALEEAVIRLCNANHKLKAIALYRYIHPCTLSDANVAVTKIQNMT